MPAHLHRLALPVFAAVALVATACSSGPATIEVAIDGGTEDAVFVRDVHVRAAPGDTVVITHANRVEAGLDEIPIGRGTVTHALIGGASAAELPPVFVSGPEGAGPNAGVWGLCRGGGPAAAVGSCPIPPVEGPTAWNGTDYWSTGAFLAGDSREVPLAEDIAPGEHVLICALHPDLAVTIEVTDGGERDGDVSAPTGLPTDLPVPPENPLVVQVGASDGQVQHNAFIPETISITAGQAVTWTAAVATPHDLTLGGEAGDLTHTTPGEALPTPVDGPWDGDQPIRSGFLSTAPDSPGGQSFRVTFAEPGTYAYACRFHPGMTGTVEVT